MEYDSNKQEESKASYDRFEKEYFEKGRKYPLLIGGTEKGFVTVREPVGEGCISLAATVVSSVPLSNAQFALAATTTKGLGIHDDWRRPVSAQERAEFLILVKKGFGQQKVENISESSVKVDNLRSTKLNDAGRPVLMMPVHLSRIWWSN